MGGGGFGGVWRRAHGGRVLRVRRVLSWRSFWSLLLSTLRQGVRFATSFSRQPVAFWTSIPPFDFDGESLTNDGAGCAKLWAAGFGRRGEVREWPNRTHC